MSTYQDGTIFDIVLGKGCLGVIWVMDRKGCTHMRGGGEKGTYLKNLLCPHMSMGYDWDGGGRCPL